MNKEVDYAYDSDESDEDFCPEKEGLTGDSDVTSEDISDEDDEVGFQNEETSKREKSQKTAKGTRKANRKRKTKNLKHHQGNNDDEEDENAINGDEVNGRRNTRFMDTSKNGNSKGLTEKEELESDEEKEKSRRDALWADFLSDVKQVEPTVTTNKKSTNADRRPKKQEQNESKDQRSLPNAEKKITITEVLDFAGEEVRVEKNVSVDSIKENKSSDSKKSTITGRDSLGRTPTAGVKRPSSMGPAGSGLGSILTQIGKKKKISVLEKTKLDWNSFKQDEGIDEELQTFNKGKDGYLERQDFLQRTDVRQFEIEKSLRASRRTK